MIDSEQEIRLCVEQNPDYPFDTSKVAAKIREVLNGVEFEEEQAKILAGAVKKISQTNWHTVVWNTGQQNQHLHLHSTQIISTSSFLH